MRFNKNKIKLYQERINRYKQKKYSQIIREGKINNLIRSGKLQSLSYEDAMEQIHMILAQN